MKIIMSVSAGSSERKLPPARVNDLRPSLKSIGFVNNEFKPLKLIIVRTPNVSYRVNVNCGGIILPIIDEDFLMLSDAGIRKAVDASYSAIGTELRQRDDVLWMNKARKDAYDEKFPKSSFRKVFKAFKTLDLTKIIEKICEARKIMLETENSSPDTYLLKKPSR